MSGIDIAAIAVPAVAAIALVVWLVFALRR